MADDWQGFIVDRRASLPPEGLSSVQQKPSRPLLQEPAV